MFTAGIPEPRGRLRRWVGGVISLHSIYLFREGFELFPPRSDLILHRAEFGLCVGQRRGEVPLLLITDQPVVAAGVERTPFLRVEGRC
jgi:hypothetical protein